MQNTYNSGERWLGKNSEKVYYDSRARSSVHLDFSSGNEFADDYTIKFSQAKSFNESEFSVPFSVLENNRILNIMYKLSTLRYFRANNFSPNTGM